MKQYLSILTLFFASLGVCQAQKTHWVGVSSNYMVELFPKAYHYRVWAVEATYRCDFVQTKWCALAATGSLHYSTTHYSAVAFPTNNYPRGYEVGITAGLLWKIKLLSDYLGVYLGGFIGPMYTPKMPARQGGIINFSNNLCLGITVKLTPSLDLETRYSYRHLSNAGTATPNRGLNNHCAGIGLFYKF